MAAIFLPVVAAVAVLGLQLAAAWSRRPSLLVGATSWLVFGLVTTLTPWIPLDTGRPAAGAAITVAVANVAADNPSPTEALEDILAQEADVVVVPEASAELHRALQAAFDHAVREDAQHTPALGVYSDLELRASEAGDGILEGSRIVVAEVGGAVPFTLWGLHLARPWFTNDFPFQLRPGGHARQVDQVVERTGDDRVPAVLAGDLNLTDRGRGYRRATADHDDAMRGIWAGPTGRKPSLRPLLLRIDHILVPEGWCADRQRRFEIRGSDHRGVAARIGPCEGD